MKMELQEIRDVANSLLGKHNLNWKFKFSNGKRVLGQCQPRNRTITFSKVYKDVEEYIILDIIKHEIAHAIDVERRGYSSHDSYWKKIAQEVGAEPSRKTHSELLEKAYKENAKYVVVCPKHGIIGYRNRKSQDALYTCRGCGNYVEIKEQGVE